MENTKIVLVAIFLVPIVSAASAGTYVFEMTDVEVGLLHSPDLGAQFSGIRTVTIRAIGVGGRAHYECTQPAANGWYDLDLNVNWGNGWIAIPTSNQVPFDIAAVAVVEEGSWLPCEDTARCPLSASVSPRGFSGLFCGWTEMEVPAISRLVITITADSVVSAEKLPWGSMKAMYLGCVAH